MPSSSDHPARLSGCLGDVTARARMRAALTRQGKQRSENHFGAGLPLCLGLRDHFQGIVHLDAEVTDHAFELGMSEQQLDRGRVLGPAVDSGSPSSASAYASRIGGQLAPQMSASRICSQQYVDRVGYAGLVGSHGSILFPSGSIPRQISRVRNSSILSSTFRPSSKGVFGLEENAAGACDASQAYHRYVDFRLMAFSLRRWSRMASWALVRASSSVSPAEKSMGNSSLLPVGGSPHARDRGDLIKYISRSWSVSNRSPEIAIKHDFAADIWRKR